LRKDRNLKLEEVAEATGIPKSSLHRLEVDSPDLNAHETRVGYQDIVALAKFYGVSTDYICGLTENLTHQNTAIDKLRLSDEAITELSSGKLNTRLLSELITHPDFVGLLAALEVYLDGKVAARIESQNKVLDMVVNAVSIKSKGIGQDEIYAALTEASTDPDDYIRFRLTRRFDRLAKSLHEAHSKEATDPTGDLLVQLLGGQIKKYEETKSKTGSEAEAKLAVLADQMGVDLKKSNESEKQSLLNLLGRSKWTQFFKKRK